jgi:hypothetical protein
MAERKKENKKKEEVHEIYEVKKDGKEKIVETNGIIQKDSIRKGEIERENKLLRNILIAIGIFLLVIVLAFFIAKASHQFKYKGVKFNIVKEGDLILYHSSFPIIYNGSNAVYNIYLRNDPRELEKKVPAEGTLVSIKDTVINITQGIECDGKEGRGTAIANLVNLYGAIGKKIMKDENASCDPLGRYMYINIRPGNETSIKEFGPGCYNININNCEILEGTERFISGMLVRINTKTNSSKSSK